MEPNHATSRRPSSDQPRNERLALAKRDPQRGFLRQLYQTDRPDTCRVARCADYHYGKHTCSINNRGLFETNTNAMA